jgi:hypothetical protein
MSTLPAWYKKTKDGLALVPDAAPPAMLAELARLGIAAETYVVRLPDWAVMSDSGVIVVDPVIAYPAILAELERTGAKPAKAKLDQFWAEIAYQVMKLELQRATGRFGFSIKVLNRPEWAVKALPAAAGVAGAIKGGIAKNYHARMRGL